MEQISTEDLNRYRFLVSRLQNEVDKLEKEAKEVEQFYQSTDNQKNDCKNKGRENAPSGSKKPLQRASQETQAELMCHFSKLACEESELSKEEAHKQLSNKLALEATYANKTIELSTELSKVDTALRSLKTTMIAQCRKLSLSEKSRLANAIPKLSPHNLLKALEIVKENNPNFQHSIDMVTLDLEAESDYTVWRLYMFVKNSLEVQEGASVDTHEDNIKAKDRKNNGEKKRIV